MVFPYVEAQNYTRVSRLHPRSVNLIVLHDMEAQEKLDTAENVALFFKNSGVKASCHLNIDVDSIVRSVYDRHVAWAAPGANHDGLQYEHAGYANQTRKNWLDTYGVRMLTLSARQAARDCRRYKLPIRFVDAADLKAGGTRRRGITTHAQVTEAFHESTHTDPGAGFPMGWYLGKVQFYYDAVSYGDIVEAYRGDGPVLGGAALHPAQVRRVQRALGMKLLTGHYRRGTRNACRQKFGTPIMTRQELDTLGVIAKFDVVA